MIYSIDHLTSILICGHNDEIIGNPYRWYADAFLQLTYNYGRVHSSGVIHDKHEIECWMDFIDEYGYIVFKHNTLIDYNHESLS
jgi:hypothetical protein